jgi:branched-chain amino acid transport system permease protein
MLTVLLDGIADGLLLFVLAWGFSLTLGLTKLINLAHGAFAMAGGYVVAVLVNTAGLPSFVALPIAPVIVGLIGLVLERTLYRHAYRKDHFDQVLFTVGLVFIAIAIVDYAMGVESQSARALERAAGDLHIDGLRIPSEQVLTIGICGVLAVLAQYMLRSTRFGSRIRAAIDEPSVAAGLGLNVRRIRSIAFALACGLAALAGALAAEIVGLDPYFPVRILLYVLVVAAAGAPATIAGPLAAALLLGMGEIASKHYLPGTAPFVVYVVGAVVLIWRPQLLFSREMSR